MEKAAILVDENNAQSQFHKMGIEGIQPWVSFYETTDKRIRANFAVEEVSYFMYGAIVPKSIDTERHQTRKRFFKALVRDGINVHKAFCLPDPKSNELQEKGVDMLIGLDLVARAQEGIKYLYVFSGDTDLVPAVQRAQSLGSKVIAIISKKQPAKLMRRYANRVLFLEDLVREIPSQYIVTKKGEVVA